MGEGGVSVAKEGKQETESQRGEAEREEMLAQDQKRGLERTTSLGMLQMKLYPEVVQGGVKLIVLNIFSFHKF